MNVNFNVLNLHFAIKWPFDWPSERAASTETALSRPTGLCDATLEESCYETCYLSGPRGATDPFTGNTKRWQIILVYLGV